MLSKIIDTLSLIAVIIKEVVVGLVIGVLWIMAYSLFFSENDWD